MNIKNVFLLGILLLASSSSLFGMQSTNPKNSILAKQLGYGALGITTLGLTPAFAFSTASMFVLEAAEASKGGDKSMAGTGTCAFLTAASVATSVYSFAQVYRLQKQKGLLKW